MLSDANYNARKNKTEGNVLKILTPKEMLQRLSIALAQVKAGNNSESLLNEIRQIVYSLYQAKQITKEVYNNIIKSANANTITINLKYPHQHGMIYLNYQMDHILYQIYKIILSIFKKNMEKILINHQYRYM